MSKFLLTVATVAADVLPTASFGQTPQLRGNP
jgi:hypothetical protein